MTEPGDLNGRRGKNRQAARRRGHGIQRERVVEALRQVRPVAISGLCRGTVVWARIPFAEQSGESKSRPAVVVGVEGRSISLLPVTGSTKESVQRSDLYVRLTDWAAAGLTRPCVVTRRRVTVDIIDVSTVVGALGRDDSVRVFAGLPSVS